MLSKDITVKNGMVRRKTEDTSVLLKTPRDDIKENFKKGISLQENIKKVRKEKNKMEYLDRSIKNNWKRYMAANPFYFQEAFRKEFSKEAVIDAANEMFN